MKNSKLKSLSALAVVLLVVIVLAAMVLFGGEDFTFANTLWAILPPVVAIGLALITKEVYSSLFVGVLVGALMPAESETALIKPSEMMVSIVPEKLNFACIRAPTRTPTKREE